MIYTGIQFQQFIRSFAHIPNPATTLESIMANKMLLEHQHQELEVYYRVDEYGVIKELSQRITRLTGFTRKELIGMPLNELLHIERPQQEPRYHPEYGDGFIKSSATLCCANGDHAPVEMESRLLNQPGDNGGHEGLICRHGVSSLAGLSESHMPLLSLSVSGGVLSCNRAAEGILKEWQCGLGDRLPDPMQEHVLDTWLAGRPLCFGAYAYLPLSGEGIVLFSAEISDPLPVQQPVCQFHSQAYKQMQAAF